MNKEEILLDIAMNLNRVGNWAADDFSGKKKRIVFFLEQTSAYINSLNQSAFSKKFMKTFERFLKEFNQLKKLKFKDPLEWAEKMMTWGNILTHRAKLA